MYDVHARIRVQVLLSLSRALSSLFSLSFLSSITIAPPSLPD